MGYRENSKGEALLARCRIKSICLSGKKGFEISWLIYEKFRSPIIRSRLESLPLLKLSRQKTRAPRPNKVSQVQEPRNPAPPVTRTFCLSKLMPSFNKDDTIKLTSSEIKFN